MRRKAAPGKKTEEARSTPESDIEEKKETELQNSNESAPTKRRTRKANLSNSNPSVVNLVEPASNTKGAKTKKSDKLKGNAKDLPENTDEPDEENDMELGETSDEKEKIKDASKETSKSTKRKRGPAKDEPSKSAKKEKLSVPKKAPKNETKSDLSSIDFNNKSKSTGGNPWNFKISSWNINGIRAWLEKEGLSYLHHEQPDILCVQETKCSDDKLPEDIKKVEGYHTYWLSGDKDGYSGVGLLSKKEPINVEYGIGISDHDNEGRVITVEYEEFFLVAAYVPNAGRGLVRLDYRQKWDEDFRAYLKKLDSQKPVILCGDLNVAHEEIDLANPKTNKKNAGFTKEEREGFSSLLKEGFVDSFRHLYPDITGAYTFWTYMMNARAKNVGWRLDYFVISKRLCEKLCDNVIRKDVLGSDHCPITLFLAL